MSPTISVIIPTYNRAYCVTAAIESVLQQTYKDVEIIVVDDGSTDHTQEVLSPYIKSGMINYFRQQNAGVSAARNAGIRRAKGEWIACLDSDDRWLPGKLKSQMDLIAQSPVELGCVIGNVQFVPSVYKNETSFSKAPFNPRYSCGICFNMHAILLTRFLLFNQTAIIKKIFLEKIGGYNEKYRYLEDYDLALKLSFLCTWGYDIFPHVLYKRDSNDSLSSKVDSFCQIETVIQIYKELQLFLQNYNIEQPRLLRRRIEICRNNMRLRHFCLGRLWERSRSYISRRFPWYPKPEVSPILIECDHS